MKSPELTPSQERHFNELQDWVQNKFGQHSKYYLYEEAFNEHFTHYQGDVNKKLEIASLEQGFISCAVAAALTGIWWSFNNEVAPEFLIRIPNNMAQEEKSRHVLLALPFITYLTEHDFYQSIVNPQGTQDPNVVEFNLDTQANKYSLYKTPVGVRPSKFRRIQGVSNFVADRYKLFNYHPQYPYQPAEASSYLSTRSVPDEQPQK